MVNHHVERALQRAFLRAAYRRSDEYVSPIGHVVGFWIFLAAAAILFAAAAFLPMWREHQDVLAAKEQAVQRLDDLRSELAQLRAIAQALGEDPVINERAALRDLKYRAPGQEVLETEPSETIITSRPEPEIARHGTYACRASWLAYIPEKYRHLDTWIDWVCRPDIRRGMLIAAAFLISAALVLFAPPSPRSARRVLVDPADLA
ncbi:MAG: hypothetical protein JXQ73_17745 [Phycisphaerae bacterium]|nr:hypothetical protein [Phycisphaerae bacterium]